VSSSTDPLSPDGAGADAPTGEVLSTGDAADPSSGDPAAPTPPTRGRVRCTLRWLGVVVVALVGAAIGATIAGQTSVGTEVGQVELTARPAVAGGFTMSLAPLGTIELPTASPMKVQARLVALSDELLVRAGRDVAEGRQPMSQEEAERVADEAATKIGEAAVPLTLRSIAGGAVGGAAAALLVYRARREALVGALTGLVALTAASVAAFALLPDTMDDAEVHGALGLLPQASPGLVEGAEGVQEYISKTFRNIEGLYTGYVRSAAADRIAKRSDRILAVSGDPADEEVRRRVSVLATSQGVKGVLWIVRPAEDDEEDADEDTGERSAGDAEERTDEDESERAEDGAVDDRGTDEGAAGDGATGDATDGDTATTEADADDGRPSFPELEEGIPVLFVLPDDPAGVELLDRFAVLVLDADGSMPTGPDAEATEAAALVVEAGGGAPDDDLRLPTISTGDEPTASGARLTDARSPVRITTGTAVDDRLEAVVLSFGRDSAEVLQAQLVTVADGDISMKRVLR
jgi:hypothetical protein